MSQPAASARPRLPGRPATATPRARHSLPPPRQRKNRPAQLPRQLTRSPAGWLQAAIRLTALRLCKVGAPADGTCAKAAAGRQSGHGAPSLLAHVEAAPIVRCASRQGVWRPAACRARKFKPGRVACSVACEQQLPDMCRSLSLLCRTGERGGAWERTPRAVTTRRPRAVRGLDELRTSQRKMQSGRRAVRLRTKPATAA